MHQDGLSLCSQTNAWWRTIVVGVDGDGRRLAHEQTVRDLEVVRDRLVHRIPRDGCGEAGGRLLVLVDGERALDRLQLRQQRLDALPRVRGAAHRQLPLAVSTASRGESRRRGRRWGAREASTVAIHAGRRAPRRRAQ